MRFKISAVISAAMITALVSPVRAQDSANYQKALAEIINTAEKICQSAPLEQTSEGVSLTGDAKAKLGGVVGKVVDLGVSGAGKYESGKSLGVLQKDLIQALQIGNNCKLEVFKVLERDLIQHRQTPSVAPAKGDDHSQSEMRTQSFVAVGDSNWDNFPKEVKDARNACLTRLFRYGTHPENFRVDATDPNVWSNFYGYLKMRLLREPTSLDVLAIELRITTILNNKPNGSGWYNFVCQFRDGAIFASDFSQ